MIKEMLKISNAKFSLVKQIIFLITSKISPQGFTPTALLKNELKNYVQQFSYKSHLLKHVYRKNVSKEDNSFDDSIIKINQSSTLQETEEKS